MTHNHLRLRVDITHRPWCLAALLACGFLAVSAASPASAKWLLETGKDAAGRETKAASVSAQNREAVLRLDCENGLQQLSITANRSFERGTITSVITFDRRQPKAGLLTVYSGRSDIPIFDISPTELMRTERLAIELQPITRTSSRYVFDTSGAKLTVKAVRCDPKRASLLRRFESRISPLRARLKKSLPSRAQSKPSDDK
jgi:hypothetical protein